MLQLRKGSAECQQQQSHHIGSSERGEVKRHAAEMVFLSFFLSTILALDLSLPFSALIFYMQYILPVLHTQSYYDMIL